MTFYDKTKFKQLSIYKPNPKEFLYAEECKEAHASQVIQNIQIYEKPQHKTRYIELEKRKGVE